MTLEERKAAAYSFGQYAYYLYGAWPEGSTLYRYALSQGLFLPQHQSTNLVEDDKVWRAFVQGFQDERKRIG